MSERVCVCFLLFFFCAPSPSGRGCCVFSVLQVLVEEDVMCAATASKQKTFVASVKGVSCYPGG